MYRHEVGAPVFACSNCGRNLFTHDPRYDAQGITWSCNGDQLTARLSVARAD